MDFISGVELNQEVEIVGSVIKPSSSELYIFKRVLGEEVKVLNSFKVDYSGLEGFVGVKLIEGVPMSDFTKIPPYELCFHKKLEVSVTL